MDELTDKDFREMHERSRESRIDWQDYDNYMYRRGFRAGVLIAQADAESASLRDEVIADTAKPIADAAKPIEFDAIRDGDTIRRTLTHSDGTVTVTTGVVAKHAGQGEYLLTSRGTVLASRGLSSNRQTLELLNRREPKAGQYIWITEFKGKKLSEPIFGRVSSVGLNGGVSTLGGLPDDSTWASPSEVTAWKPGKVGGLDD